MKPQHQEYKGHHIELREREGEREAKPELLIDKSPVLYGQLPNGLYFLHEYAFDWSKNLMDLARKFIDYKRKVEIVRGERESRKGEQ